MKTFSFFTGGKDSTAALLMAIKTGLNPDLLVTIYPGRSDSYMFHTVNLRFTLYHALLMNMNIMFYRVSGVKEKEVDELYPLIERLYESGYTVATAGGIASNYQRRRLEKVLNSFGIELYSPFWGLPQDEVLKSYLDMGIKYMLVSISSGGLDKDSLGWIIDGEDDIEKLITLGKKYGFNPTGEGGEYESFVIYTPIFWGEIYPMKYRIHWDGFTGYIELEKVGIKKTDREVQSQPNIEVEGGIDG